MPQFDTFIFSSSLFYFIISFFVVLYSNFSFFLPNLSGIQKLRFKISKKSVNFQTRELSKKSLGFPFSNLIKNS